MVSIHGSNEISYSGEHLCWKLYEQSCIYGSTIEDFYGTTVQELKDECIDNDDCMAIEIGRGDSYTPPDYG